MKRIRLAALKLRIRWKTASLNRADMRYARAVFNHNVEDLPYEYVTRAAERYSRIKEKIRLLEVRCEAIRRTF